MPFVWKKCCIQAIENSAAKNPPLSTKVQLLLVIVNELLLAPVLVFVLDADKDMQRNSILSIMHDCHVLPVEVTELGQIAGKGCIGIRPLPKRMHVPRPLTGRCDPGKESVACLLHER